MIDFHSHILPNVDDGPDSVRESLSMLRESFQQGVDCMVASSHFYADQEYPREFLRRRNHSFRLLQAAMTMSAEVYPRVVPGAEVLYFPGISDSEEIASLMIGHCGCILVEPPMAKWSQDILDDISALRENFGCTPVIAHVDRFMYHLHDPSLMERVLASNMLVQVNAEYFLNPKTVRSAMKHLKNGHIHLLGSDCHNLDSRPPNLALARRQAKAYGLESEFKKLHQNAGRLLLRKERV